MKNRFETLAALCAGAALLSGCGAAGAPVNAAEVPAASESKPSAPAAPAEAAAAVTAQPAVTAAPTAAPAVKPAKPKNAG